MGYEKIYQWSQSGKSITGFTLDLLKAQDMIQKENIFYHLERPDRKLCGLLFKDRIYLIGSERETQSQLLEAVIEEIINKFAEFYKFKLDSYEGAFVSEFRDFDGTISTILDHLKDIVNVVMAYCDACGFSIHIIVKKSLFEKAENSYPIPLVYNHKGHAILIYLDRQYHVRASEIVDLSSE